MSADSNQITMYETPDGRVRVEVRFEDENLWLSQKLMAELFDVTVPTICEHLKNCFAKGELAAASVIRDFRITEADGKTYNTKPYATEFCVSKARMVTPSAS